jgi:hypothetical protein
LKRLLLIFLLLPVVGQAWTYHVSKSGSDSNDGKSVGAAWLTLTPVNNILPGDTVYFGSGAWRGTTLNAVSGTSGDWTAYLCEPGLETNHAVKIFASNLLSHWIHKSGSVWKCTRPGAIYCLYQDSLLLDETSGTTPGASLWSQTADSVYINIGSSDTSQIEAVVSANESKSAVILTAKKYIEFNGIYFGYSGNRLMECDYSDENFDYIHVENCKLTNACGDGGQNPSLVYSNTMEGADGGWGNLFDADSFAYVWTIDHSNSHGNGFTLYSMSATTVQHSAFYGHFEMTAFYIKNDNNLSISNHDTVRYNTFNADCGASIQLYQSIDSTVVYGNIFYGPADGIHLLWPYQFNNRGYYSITNNTFYNCAKSINDWNYETQDPPTVSYRTINNIIKYNIFYGSPSATQITIPWGDTINATGATIDSNNYYSATFRAYNYSGGHSYTDRNWTQWKAMGFDSNSVTTDPAFNDAANGDFSRPDANAEMFHVYPGNDTFSFFGAIQDTVITPPADTTPPAITNVRDSLVTATTASIFWSTGESTVKDSVLYGTTTACTSKKVATNGTSHRGDLTSLSSSTKYYFKVRSYDTADNDSTSALDSLTTLTPDVTPPTISDIVASPGLDTCSVHWHTTDEAANGTVYYNTNNGASWSSTGNGSSYATSHYFQLQSLVENQTYYYWIESCDEAAIPNCDSSSVATFETLTGGIVAREYLPIKRDTLEYH